MGRGRAVFRGSPASAFPLAFPFELTRMESECCLLCNAQDAHLFSEVRGRTYHRCRTCHLAFLTPCHRLNPATERAAYLKHNNSPDDLGYRHFLSRLTEHLMPRLPPNTEGLDFGCGPGPTLSVMLEEQGFAMTNYDPFFMADSNALNRIYDFITCTETVEHFYSPAREFHLLDQLLRPGGWLGIMTEIMLDDARFATWWYVSEPTHVCFYTQETMAWLANQYGWEMVVPRKNVTLFHK